MFKVTICDFEQLESKIVALKIGSRNLRPPKQKQGAAHKRAAPIGRANDIQHIGPLKYNYHLYNRMSIKFIFITSKVANCDLRNIWGSIKEPQIPPSTKTASKTRKDL